MTLPAGTRLGPYEVLAPLGAGGMGEVYRARDPKLGREIAIKVLPETTAADLDRRQRFEQEARSASALNHPNILTIYDIGSSDGTLYIAMELVEGRTLRELIAAEPLPTKRLLEVAVQIAEGLAKAHAAGIVHRDLKPENLMISKDGYVKILDFGLAKLTEPVTQELSALPTAIAAPTQPGTVMGTAGYMSPEQASGQPVDFRSDQFNLGSILYEMATAKKAFQKKTGAETLVAIIKEEPEPLSQTAPQAPAPVRWIVERCLAKDPEERYASTKDLARDLKNVRDHLSETSASGALAPVAPAKARRLPWLVPAALAVVAGIGVGLLLREVTAGRPDLHIKFHRLTFRRGAIISARFAPDGQTFVYGAAWEGGPLEVYSVRTDSSESRSLGLPSADLLAVSSSGELALSLDRHYVVGFEAAGTLARAPLGGGAPREILEQVQDADWSPDGKNLAVTRYMGNRSRLEYPIGKVLYDTAAWVSNVRVSPKGDLVAFIDHPRRGDNVGLVKVVDVSGKVRLTGPKANTGLAWSPRGDEVWSSFSETSISATSLSGRTRTAFACAGDCALDDIFPDGRVLLSRKTARREMFGVTDGRERNLTWLDWSFPYDISPDSKVVLFNEESIEPNQVYIRKLDGSPAVRLGEGLAHAFSADGKWVLTSDPSQRQLVLLPSGPGEPKRLPETGIHYLWATWFPDGLRILVFGNEPGKGPRLFIQDLERGKPRPITPEGVSILFKMVSPDGRWVAATGPDRRIALYPTEAGEPRPVPGLNPEDVPMSWTEDGRALYVWRPSEPPGRIDLFEIATGKRTLWKEFRPPDPAGVLQVGPAVVAPDGATYVYTYRRALDELYLATGIR
jgi:serine/threonine protein kinase/Tol biopolymer transport system component